MNGDKPIEILDWPISEWIDSHDLLRERRVRVLKATQCLGAATVRELINHTETELRTVRNCGDTTVDRIKRALAKYGLSLKAESKEK